MIQISIFNCDCHDPIINIYQNSENLTKGFRLITILKYFTEVKIDKNPS